MTSASAKIATCDRRSFVGGAAVSTALMLGQITEVRASTAQAGGPHPATLATLGAVKHVDAGLLNIGYFDVGPRSGPTVLLFHGWPYDVHTYAEVAPLLVAKGYRVIIPYLRGFGSTTFRSSQTLRNAQQAALAVDGLALMDALKIPQAIVAGCDWGARTANIMAVLWPQRCKALVSVSGYLIGSPEANAKPLMPALEHQWWYQFYFATDRGRAGYAANTKAFNRLIWELASPQWKFQDAVFDRSAAAFDNPDHVDIVIHNYRWRLSVAEGERQYDEIEARLAAGPPVTVPTITLEGDANGAPHPDPANYRVKFTAPYAHRLIQGGIGHNLPQEAPQAFAQAILDVMHLPN